jgi:NADH:ubiquinone oxidoreductase subunit 3 (subunit A)
MVEVVAIIACAIVAIVILTYIKDLLEGKRKKSKPQKKNLYGCKQISTS